jgi:hypothetical protein
MLIEFKELNIRKNCFCFTLPEKWRRGEKMSKVLSAKNIAATKAKRQDFLR